MPDGGLCARVGDHMRSPSGNGCSTERFHHCMGRGTTVTDCRQRSISGGMADRRGNFIFPAISGQFHPFRDGWGGRDARAPSGCEAGFFVSPDICGHFWSFPLTAKLRPEKFLFSLSFPFISAHFYEFRRVGRVASERHIPMKSPSTQLSPGKKGKFQFPCHFLLPPVGARASMQPFQGIGRAARQGTHPPRVPIALTLSGKT